MLKKLFKFIPSLLIWYFIGSLFYLTATGAKVLNSSLPTFLLFIIIFLVAWRLLQKTLRKINIGNSTFIKRFYNLSRMLLIVGAILLLVYQFIVKPIHVTVADEYMSPALHKGDKVFFIAPLITNPKREDIILYNVKGEDKLQYARVIGAPQDKILIKNGFVYLNGLFLEEPYTSQLSPTFVYNSAVIGRNCEEIKIPEGKYFVLTDVRYGGTSGSLGSGLIDYGDIVGVRFLTYFPLRLTSPIRDTSRDKDLVDKYKYILDIDKYVESINKKRVQNDVSPLKYDSRVEKSATLRLENMIKYNDFSSEATKSGYTRSKSAAAAGFNSGYIKEAISAEGHYDSNILFELYWQPLHMRDLLDKDLQYIGIASKVTNVNNCPQQVIIQHFVGQ